MASGIAAEWRCNQRNINGMAARKALTSRHGVNGQRRRDGKTYRVGIACRICSAYSPVSGGSPARRARAHQIILKTTFACRAQRRHCADGRRTTAGDRRNGVLLAWRAMDAPARSVRAPRAAAFPRSTYMRHGAIMARKATSAKKRLASSRQQRRNQRARRRSGAAKRFSAARDNVATRRSLGFARAHGIAAADACYPAWRRARRAY